MALPELPPDTKRAARRDLLDVIGWLVLAMSVAVVAYLVMTVVFETR